MNIKEYIAAIESGDTNLTEINLRSKNGRGVDIASVIHDVDIAPLMAALRANPQVAQRIKALYLDYNELTTINDVSILSSLNILSVGYNRIKNISVNMLNNLTHLHLNNNKIKTIILSESAKYEFIQIQDNPLTTATRMTLQALVDMGENIQIDYHLMFPYVRHGSQAISLTNDILEEHFISILAYDEIEYMYGSEFLLKVGMPIEIVDKIDEYLRARPGVASMSFMQSTFYKWKDTHWFNGLIQGNNEQLSILNAYFKNSNLLKIRMIFNGFLIQNGFNAANLYEKNVKGFTPLALAKQMADNPNHQNIKSIIPFINEHTSYTGLMYYYFSTFLSSITGVARNNTTQKPPSYAKAKIKGD